MPALVNWGMLHDALIHRPDTHFKKKDPLDPRLGDRIQGAP